MEYHNAMIFVDNLLLGRHALTRLFGETYAFDLCFLVGYAIGDMAQEAIGVSALTASR